MDQPFQRFGLISGHLHRLVESAGWGKVPKAACSGAAHLTVERKHFFAQVTYHRDDGMCCRGADSPQQEMGEAAPLCIPTAANRLPHNPAAIAAVVDRAVCCLSWCGQSPPWNTISCLLCRMSTWGSTWSQVMTSWAMLTTAQELPSN